MTEQEFRKRIVDEALGWKGARYQLGARVKPSPGNPGACDCATLILAVYQNVGIVPPDEDAHLLSQDWWHHTSEELYKIRVIRHCVKTVEAVTYRSLGAKQGDIVLVKACNAKIHNHGGIVISWPHLIHAINPSVDVVDGTTHSMWGYQFVEVYSPWEKWLERDQTI